METIKILLTRYERLFLFSEMDSAEEVAALIYAELINIGCLPGEINNSDFMENYIENTEVYMEEDAMDSLLIDLAILSGRDLLSPVEETETAPVNEEYSSMYAVVEYTLDHIKGKKEMRIVPLIFDNTDDLTEYLNFSLNWIEEDLNISDKGPKLIGVSDLEKRENMVKTLLSQKVAGLEVVADNIPEDCAAACVISVIDRESLQFERTTMFAAYKVVNYKH